MYRQIMIPTEKNHSVNHPEEFYGFRVEVLAFPLEASVGIDKLKLDPDAFYDTIKLDFSGFKFNRDDANER